MLRAIVLALPSMFFFHSVDANPRQVMHLRRQLHGNKTHPFNHTTSRPLSADPTVVINPLLPSLLPSITLPSHVHPSPSPRYSNATMTVTDTVTLTIVSSTPSCQSLSPSSSPVISGVCPGGACSPDGALICGSDSTRFCLCDHRRAVDMGHVAPGTKCVNGVIVAARLR